MELAHRTHSCSYRSVHVFIGVCARESVCVCVCVCVCWYLYVYAYTLACKDGRRDGGTEVRTDGATDGRTEGGREGGMEGWSDRCGCTKVLMMYGPMYVCR